MAEEYYQIPENPEYDIDRIRKLQNSDPGNADTVFNPLILRLLTNIAALKEILDAAGVDISDALAAATAAGQAADAAQRTASAADSAATDAKSAADAAQSTLNNLTSSKTKGCVYAAPSSAAGKPDFRALAADDIPSLNASKITAGTLALARGGTGQATAPLGLYALINGASALTSTGLATGDYIPIGDVSATTGKKVTLANLAAFLSGSAGLRIATGSYAGDGGTSKTINIGFTPKFVAITVDGSGSDCDNPSYAYEIVYYKDASDSAANIAHRHLSEAIYTGQPSELIYGANASATNARFYKRNYSVSGSGITITGTVEETYWQNRRSSAATGYYIMNNSDYKYRWVAIG